MMVNQCILVQCVPTRFPPKMRWNSITIKLISAASYVMAAELMKFPWLAAFHWIFPLGPLTFWWSVNSAQRPRNSQCSRENMNEPARVFSVFFFRRGCCEWFAQGLKMWNRERVIQFGWWVKKHRSVKIVKESEITDLTLLAPQCSDWYKWRSC